MNESTYIPIHIGTYLSECGVISDEQAKQLSGVLLSAHLKKLLTQIIPILMNHQLADAILNLQENHLNVVGVSLIQRVLQESAPVLIFRHRHYIAPNPPQIRPLWYVFVQTPWIIGGAATVVVADGVQRQWIVKF